MHGDSVLAKRLESECYNINMVGYVLQVIGGSEYTQLSVVLSDSAAMLMIGLLTVPRLSIVNRWIISERVDASFPRL